MGEPRVLLVTREHGWYRVVGYADLDDARRMTNAIVQGAPRPTLEGALRSIELRIGEHARWTDKEN